jgi:transposase InsO family protein
MDYFTKWPEAYDIPNQEASTLAEVLVTNFCHFRAAPELHSDQGRHFESCLIQEVLQHLCVSKTRTTPLHPQSDGMIERYIKTV